MQGSASNSAAAAVMEPKQIDLYEFLVESELQQYYNSIKNELKITNSSHLKYATDEDLKQLGLSRPEIRRLRKFYEKYYPHGYLSKIKRLLQPPRKEDGLISSAQLNLSEPTKLPSSPSKIPSNKHIIPADSICVNKQLGTGEFGIVQQGVWTNGTERIQVAIKCLCRERMQSNPMEFLKEAAIMHANEHENIVRLYGVVLDTDSLMLVTELAHLRSLLECLKDSGLRVSFLTVPTLCEFAMQICNGMMYLESKRLIHRDLAARNILVFSKNKVKISDFGLSRALGVGKDYYKTNFNVNLKLPIAWCAPECINYLRFTNSSDVWAYGVCLWEMFSYGFQPWAALTGLQILEAIDEPNYQRLEQPECCPREYYNLMLKCWQHDQYKRPKFSEIFGVLPDMKPEQLKTVVNNCESKKDNLLYRQGEIVTVLDKNTNSSFWKGVLNSGKTGLFNPANTVAYLEGLPCSTNRDSFHRTSERSSKRKLRSEMISMPQNDLKHTGHVGLDGAYFGDVAFLGNSQNYNRLPRQIVTPYKPSEDIEQTPLLLPPTPTSPDSLQTASGYFPEELASSSTNPTFINSNENTPKHHSSFGSSFDFPPKPVFSSSNPFAIENSGNFTLHNNNYGLENNSFTNANLEDDSLPTTTHKTNTNWPIAAGSNTENPHEYHEISDDEITADKVFDLGPSLLDEINSMFGSISTGHGDTASGPKSPDFEHTNKKNEITELTSKLNRKNSSSDSNGNKSKKKTAGTVKQISVKDEKILNHAIEIANEISARSMTDLVSDHTQVAQSPKRKFSFRFPHLSHHGSSDKDTASASYYNGNSGNLTQSKERKNFSEELKSIPDLQNSITDEGREAYNSLIEKKSTKLLENFDKNSSFSITNSKTLPRNLINIKNSNKSRTLEKELQEAEIAVPMQQAPRPMTLPHRSTNKMRKNCIGDNDDDDESNPLRILRDKNFPMVVRPRPKNIKATDDLNGNSMKMLLNGQIIMPDAENLNEWPCESPSYLTNTGYTFPSPPPKHLADCVDAANPIPLPPRDRNKVMQTNVKRHVRKHPLIIPGYGVQRTLNKVTEITPVDEPPKLSYTSTKTDFNCNNNHKMMDNTSQKTNDSLRKTEKITQQVISTYDNVNGLKNGLDFKYPERMYENIDDLEMNLNQTSTDSASLDFESILEDDFNKGETLSSPDVIDGFCPFAIQKEQYKKSKEVNFNNSKISGLYVNEDEFRNLDIEKKKVDIINNKQPKQQLQPSTNNNELDGHVLFNKIKQNVNSAMQEPVAQNIDEPDGVAAESTNTLLISSTSIPAVIDAAEQQKLDEIRLKNCNSVSCEDLLEFADKKPKGCERGVDSDEVRIMLKVLGKDFSAHKCLTTLEFIEWDVHKALKLIRLQNIMESVDLSLNESVEALQKYDWDIETTALKLKGFKLRLS